MKTETESTNSLATAASGLAMLGAREYLQRNNLTADPAALSECLRSWVRAKLPEALSDAKAAFECHMDQVAVQTFGASMVQAGIEAARECGGVK